ncbi:unnamed protein product, partial [Mesorhabditis belari]|uniref:Palmitoyltransferase n=1 Tax=Mesorhabditis belari TaxID=2138241 RepID=A0AAF3EYW0_9BILA
MSIGRLQRQLSPLARFVLEYAGILFCVITASILYYLTSSISCPATKSAEHCDSLEFWLWVILLEIAINLYCFHHFSSNNCVSFWQRVSCVADLCRHSDEIEDFVRYEGEEQNSCTPDAKFCVDCNRRAPIRSHHCYMCNICVLRKDHHCFITGACVGLGNQRYFIVFNFWSMIGAGLCSWYILDYLNFAVMPWYPFGWAHFIAPVAVVKWVLGKEFLLNALICVAFSFGVASCVASMAFFAIQVFYTCHGYTMYEYHSLGIREEFDGDGRTINERFRLVFGPWWTLNFLVPCPWIHQRLTPEIANNLFRVRSKLL